MTEPISLLDYQRQASEATVTHFPVVRKAQIPEDASEWGREATALYSAGWDYKIRSGRRIWMHPETGYWYSEEIGFVIAHGKEAVGGAD